MFLLLWPFIPNQSNEVYHPFHVRLSNNILCRTRDDLILMLRLVTVSNIHSMNQNELKRQIVCHARVCVGFDYLGEWMKSWRRRMDPSLCELGYG